MVVYLSPELIGKPQDEIEGVIANELAHVVLQHEEVGSTRREEALASALADEKAADRGELGFSRAPFPGLSSRLFPGGQRARHNQQPVAPRLSVCPDQKVEENGKLVSPIFRPFDLIGDSTE